MRLPPRSTVALATIAAATSLGLGLLQPVATAAPTPRAAPGTTTAERQAAEAALSAVRSEVRESDQARRGGAGTPAAVPSRDLSLKLTRLALLKADLSPADRRVANGYLARPTDIGDDVGGYVVRYKKGLTVENDCTGHKPGATSRFCVNWVATSGNAPAATDANGKRDHDGIPDYVEKVRSTLQHVWSTEVGQYGYKAPLRDRQGPNRKLDIYLADLGAGGLYGYCTGERLVGNWTASGYCVLDNNYTESVFDAHTPVENLQVTAAHEFFHAVQYAYDAFEDTWMMEGTAAWVEDEVYDGVDDNRQYLAASPLSDPSNPLDESQYATYGSWIWWRYLSEQFGRDVVRQTWDRADDSTTQRGENYSLKAVIGELGSRGTSLRKELASFVVGNRVPAATYSEGAAYTPAPAVRTRTITNTGSTGALTDRIDHLASRTTEVARGSGVPDDALLNVSVDGPAGISLPTVVLTAYDGAGTAIASTTMPLDADGVGRSSIAFGAGVDHVDVTLVNASKRFQCWQSNEFSCQGDPKDDRRVFSWSAGVAS